MEIELVPEPLWGRSLYHYLSREEWRSLRDFVAREEGEKCYICGSTNGKLELHEFWKYDDENHVQELAGVHLICELCHMIKHIGYWCYTENGQMSLRRRGLSREDLIKHFCRVNNCSVEEFERHEKESLEKWMERSKHRDWRQDLGRYKSWMRNHINTVTWTKRDPIGDRDMRFQKF